MEVRPCWVMTSSLGCTAERCRVLVRRGGRSRSIGMPGRVAAASARRRVALPSCSRPPTRSGRARRRRAGRGGKIRRYGAANRLNRLGTLTYRGEGCHDPRRLRADLGRVLPRSARRARRGSVPVCVGAAVASGRARPARALRGRALRAAAAIERAWGAGSCISSCWMGCRSARESWRRRVLAARYLAGYAGRDLERRAPAGGAAPLRGRRRASSRRRSSATAGRRRT